MIRGFFVFLLGAALCGAAGAAPQALPFEKKDDWILTGVAATSLLAMDIFSGALAPGTCRWCDRDDSGGEGLNRLDGAFRNALKWSDTESANGLSNWVVYAAAPLVAFGGSALASRSAPGLFWEDAVMVAQSALLCLNFTQVVKFAAGRERPAIHFATAGISIGASDRNVSFFSGHTSLAFSLAVSAGTVSYLRGYEGAPWILGGGLLLAATGGYLRMGADRHYFTDVLLGALTGSAFGYFVPKLLHGRDRKSEGVRFFASPNGFVLAYSY